MYILQNQLEFIVYIFLIIFKEKKNVFMVFFFYKGKIEFDVFLNF